MIFNQYITNEYYSNVPKKYFRFKTGKTDITEANLEPIEDDLLYACLDAEVVAIRLLSVAEYKSTIEPDFNAQSLDYDTKVLVIVIPNNWKDIRVDRFTRFLVRFDSCNKADVDIRRWLSGQNDKEKVIKRALAEYIKKHVQKKEGSL